MPLPATETEPGRPRLHRGISAGIVGILTLVVSAFGYLREATLASRFGVSSTMDAYFGAVFIPYTIYSILITGSLAPVFIPILMQDNAIEDRSRASETFSVVTGFVLLLMLITISLGMMTAHWWLPLLFAGFTADTARMAVRLVYIIFPALLFLALSGILTATLNGFHRFALAAFVPALSNMAVIAAAILARGEHAVYWVGLGTSIGFLLQAIFLMPAVGSLGLRYRLVLALRHPAIGKLVRLGGPLLLYLLVANISLLLERNLASRISAGAVATLTYAQRLFVVPANFLAAPLAIVAYPQFAAEALLAQRGNLAQQVTRMFRMVVFLFLPVTVWAILNALPVTRAFYEHGRFSPADSLLTAHVLAIYCCSILPNAIAIMLLRCYFAIEDTVTPLLAELLNLAFFPVAAILCTARWGLNGLIISRSISFFLVAGVLIFVLAKRRGLLLFDSGVLQCMIKTAVASLTMGTATFTASRFLEPAFNTGSTSSRLIFLALLLAIGVAAYLGTARLLRIDEMHHIMETIMKLLRGRTRVSG
jgi:putative peptidoglycan lipid II flippase